MRHTSFTNLPTTCLLHSSYLKPRTLGLFRYSDSLMTRALVSTNERQVVRRLIDISDRPNGQILRSTFIQKGSHIKITIFHFTVQLYFIVATSNTLYIIQNIASLFAPIVQLRESIIPELSLLVFTPSPRLTDLVSISGPGS